MVKLFGLKHSDIQSIRNARQRDVSNRLLQSLGEVKISKRLCDSFDEFDKSRVVIHNSRMRG